MKGECRDDGITRERRRPTERVIFGTISEGNEINSEPLLHFRSEYTSQSVTQSLAAAYLLSSAATQLND